MNGNPRQPLAASQFPINRQAFPCRVGRLKAGHCIFLAGGRDPEFGQQRQPRFDLGPAVCERRDVGKQKPAASAAPSQPAPGAGQPEHERLWKFTTHVDA